MRGALAVALLLFAAPLQLLDLFPQSRIPRPFVPVGVVDDRPGPFGRGGFEELRKLRFTVVTTRELLELPAGRRVIPLAPLSGGAADELPPPITIDGLGVLSVSAGPSWGVVRRDAWVEIGRGLRGVIFDGWTALRQHPGALEAAASFADVVTRNSALFAPLTASSRVVRAVPSTELFARFVESAEAIVLVAANMMDVDRRVTLTFAPETPEAIWQNMESGAAVNFVAGPDGPTYTRTFPPHDVIVLMIRKQYR
jgi:hypothetical protein